MSKTKRFISLEEMMGSKPSKGKKKTKQALAWERKLLKWRDQQELHEEIRDDEGYPYQYRDVK